MTPADPSRAPALSKMLFFLALLLLSVRPDVEGLPASVRPLDSPYASRGLAGGTFEDAMWTDDTEVDPWASPSPAEFAPADEGWGGGTSGPAPDGLGPTLPGPPTPNPGQVPADGGLGLLALAGTAYAARRLRRRVAVSAAVLLLGLAAAPAAVAQGPPLSPGDIAIVNLDTNYGASSNPPSGIADGFAFVALVDLPAGCVIRFTDRGWTAAGTFRALVAGESEGTTVYTAPSAIPAGTVVRYRDNGSTTNSAGFSPNAQAFGGLQLAGDQVLAYQGTDAAPVFIYAAHHSASGTFDSDATNTNTSALPRGLDLGSTAIALGSQNNSYDVAAAGPGTASGSRGDLLLAVSNPANWNGSNANGLPNPQPYPSAFTVNGNGAAGTATAVGGPGWRILSAPVAGLTVADLVGLGYVQGLPDEYPVGVLPNLYLGYNGYNADGGDPDAAGPRRPNALGFVAPFLAGDATPQTQEDVPIVPGRGFIWYLYDQAFGPFAGAGGTSQSRPLPLLLPLVASGPEVNTAVAFTTADRTPASASPGPRDNFFLVGNPFRAALDLSGITKTAGAGTLQAVYQFWNPNAGSNSAAGNGTPGTYVLRTAVADATNRVDDDAQLAQGFFAEVAGSTTASPPTFSFAAASVVPASDPTFYGRPGEPADSVWTVALALAGTTESGTATYDEAAVVRFSADGALGWDVYEASKLGPFGGVWATLAPVGPGPDDVPLRLAQRSLPLALGAPIDVPVALTVAGEGGTFTATWQVAGVPDTWALTLLDTETGRTYDLRTDSSAAFASDTTDAERFVLTIVPGRATASSDAPDAVAVVGRFAPNPASGASMLHVRAGRGGPLRAVLVDALGRRVTTVFDGDVGAGQAVDLRVDTAALAGGLYVLRVEADGVVESRRLTVVR